MQTEAMNTRRLRKTPGIAILCIILFFFLFYISMTLAGLRAGEGIVNLSDRLSVYAADGTKLEPDSDTIKLVKGEELVVSFDCLKYTSKSAVYCLGFISYTTVFDVYADGDLLYSYGREAYSKGRMIGRKVHKVIIPAGYSGKQIEICFTGAKKGASIALDGMYLGSFERISRLFVIQRSFVLLGGLFLLSFGGMLLLLFLLVRDGLKLSVGTVLQGLLLMAVGMYLLCYNDLLTVIYSGSANTGSTYLEYLSLSLLPVLFLGASTFFNRNYFSQLNRILLLAGAALPVVLILLHAAGAAHLNELGPLIHLFILLYGGYTFAYTLYIRREEEQKPGQELYADMAVRTVNTGLMNLVLLCGFDLASYKLGGGYLTLFSSKMRGIWILLGGMVYATSILIGYFFHCVADFRHEETEQQLKGLAYTDTLTGISNRAYCDRVMEECRIRGTDCIVISIDLDGLKKVNDVLGHQAGDRYITDFGAMLAECFAGVRLVGRMGGDEFLVLLEGRDEALCETLLNRLQEMTDRHNAEDGSVVRFAYSAAYASTYEIPDGKPKDAYMLADQRMYRIKKEHHRQREVTG